MPHHPYLPRGVYRAPALSSSGKPVYFAVDHLHRYVEGTRAEIGPGDDPEPVIAALWRMLDDADPDHSRRQFVREGTRKLAVLLPLLALCG